jgi:hypothetical protein
MRDGKLVGGVVIVVLVLGAFAVLHNHPARSRVTRANYDRIRPGMTRAEVVALLGPPNDFKSGPVRIDPEILNILHDDGHTRFSVWFGADGMVGVFFDDSGRVRHSMYRPARPGAEDVDD